MELTLDNIRGISVYQSKKGYRFSVDALLLFSFVNAKMVRNIADLGAGSGIIGLLLAKRYPDADVALFEIQENLATLAEKNIALNSLENRVKVVKTDIREIKNCHYPIASPHFFDIVVSNPPFRKERSGLINPDEEKAIARHELKLKMPELTRAAYYLLKPKGRFFLVYSPERLAELMEIFDRKMEIKRLRFVHSNKVSAAKMVLVEAIKDGRRGLKIDRPFYIHDDTGDYSDEMRSILYQSYAGFFRG